MALKNYTTKIPAAQTAGEIQGILAVHGARKIMVDYSDAGEVECISFQIITPNGPRSFRLPARVEGVAHALAKDGCKCDMVHAANVAWRNVKDWITAQMAMVEIEQAAVEEIFLPYMTTSTGETLYEQYQKNQLLIDKE